MRAMLRGSSARSAKSQYKKAANLAEPDSPPDFEHTSERSQTLATSSRLGSFGFCRRLGGCLRLLSLGRLGSFGGLGLGSHFSALAGARGSSVQVEQLRQRVGSQLRSEALVLHALVELDNRGHELVAAAETLLGVGQGIV